MKDVLSAMTLALGALASQSSFAATTLSVPTSGQNGALEVSVDLGRKEVHYASCPAAPCSRGVAASVLAIDGFDGPIDAAEVSVEDVTLGSGRHLAHVRVGPKPNAEPEAPAWEALLVAGRPPLFSGRTGFTRGEPGERSGTDLRLLEGEGNTVILVGEVREDLRICGDDATLLDPRGLDAVSLTFRGATVQRLAANRMAAATPLTATAHHSPAAANLARLLRVTGSSGELPGAPASALADGDASTAWTEARPGRGQGEFVVLSSPYDVPIVRFAITVAPTPPRKEGSAPERFYLATSGGAYEVTLPEDAWSHPGESYEVALPEPIQTSCVAIVLGDAFTRGKTHPEVTIAELTAYSAFDHPGATLADVASALKGDPQRANIAAALLERAGPAGLAAVSAVYPELDAAGRALAVNVAASTASCVTSAPLLVAALEDADEVVRAKAEAKLHEATCGREALPALEAGLASAGARSRVAPLVAFIGREAALGALGDVLGQGGPDDRHAVRAATASAARNASPEAVRAVLVRARERSANANLDALRALALRVNDARDAAEASLSALFVANPPLDVRYLLVDVLASLADAGDAKESTRRSELALHDPSSDVRAHATESLASAADAEVRDAALHDASPRVRQAAIHAVRLGKDTRLTSSLAELVSHDPWTFVRVAAAESLADLPGSAESWRALGDALHQRSPKVREQAILSLGASGGRSYRDAIRDRLDDTKEEPAVRLAAATALGQLCDAKAVDDLTKLAVRGGSSPDSDDVSLGLSATAALGQIHPKNLESHFAPLRSKDVRPDARAAAAQAMANARHCEALP